MSNTWFTSDTHYHHKNLVKGVSNWNDKSGCRPFESIEAHNEAIILGINKYVKPDDTLYHLGDWSFGGIDKIWEFRKQINCRNIHFIFGNHDHHIENNKHLVINGDEGKAQKLLGHGTVHSDQNDFFVYAQDLFTSVQYVKTVTIHGHRIFLSHYAHRVWDKSHKGRWHLYGHSHGTIQDWGKSMDVGLDVAYRMFGEFRPFKFQEIQKIMQNKEIETPDHHNGNTND